MNNSRDKIYIPRILEGKIRKFLQVPEIIAILGARQVGKTTLMRRIYRDLPEPKIYLDFEDPETLALFDEDIHAFARLYVEGRNYVFLDEFQYSRQGGKHLKFLFDRYPTKFVISGSSSLELTFKTASALVGRIILLELFPLNFVEFLTFRDPDMVSLTKEHIHNLKPLSAPLHQRLLRSLEEFMRWGGYPRVLLAKTPEEKAEILKNLVATYLVKDIRGFFRLSSEYPIQKLMKGLALQIGGVVEYNELSQVTGLSFPGLKRHLAILEETYILRFCRPFFTNRRLELVKNPKIYFLDLGFRNHVIQDFRGWGIRPDIGALAENFVASELIKAGYDLRFWRTKSGAEVDFVIESQDGPIPIEVKAGETRVPGKSLRSFLKKYRPPRAYILHRGNLQVQTIVETPVYFFPLYAISFLESFGENSGSHRALYNP